MLVFKEPLFYLIMASKCKSSGAGNSDMSKKSHKVFHLHEKNFKKANTLYLSLQLAKVSIILDQQFSKYGLGNHGDVP